MGIVADSQLVDAIKDLQRIMKPIYDEWCAMQLSAPPAFEQYLAQDIMALGYGFSLADGNRQKLESNVVAEMLAALPHTHKTMPYEAQLSIFDRRIAESVSLFANKDALAELLTPTILSQWVKKGSGTREMAADAVRCWVDLANRIILRDGYIDTDEVSALDAFEKKLTP